MPKPSQSERLQPSLLDRLTDSGVLLQLNSWCLTDPPGTPTHDVAVRLLRAGRYFCLGTDCHNAASMPNRIRGIEVAEALVGTDEAERLTVRAPRMLLENADVRV